jgi:hypothetical protein
MVQTKLRIGEPDDEYEREADRVADQVMRMPMVSDEVETDALGEGPKPSIVQRECVDCEEGPLSEEEK